MRVFLGPEGPERPKVSPEFAQHFLEGEVRVFGNDPPGRHMILAAPCNKCVLVIESTAHKGEAFGAGNYGRVSFVLGCGRISVPAGWTEDASMVVSAMMEGLLPRGTLGDYKNSVIIVDELCYLRTTGV